MDPTDRTEDRCKLQSFHMSCQRQMLGVKWQDHVKNVDIADRTGLQTLQIKSAIGTKHCLVTLLDWMPPHLHTERYVRSLQ